MIINMDMEHPVHPRHLRQHDIEVQEDIVEAWKLRIDAAQGT